ncbi:uncharacterized protein [Spinacia oleracea]|uniref:TPX2 central domain-containing protein n=1 Tax=Spinacia oleracea TaxID=3562 RepID=A0A9R0JKX1_SPIOL|nr:uncharacterized protein LOC110778275 [Spinacia oleracea]
MVASQSSMPRSTSMISKQKLKTSSKLAVTQSKPSSNPLPQSISPTLTGASQPQTKVAQSRWSKGPLFPNLIEIAAQKKATTSLAASYQPTVKPNLQSTTQPTVKPILKPPMQPTTQATVKPVIATRQPSLERDKAAQQLHKVRHQPEKAALTGTKPHLEKRAFVAPMRATKSVM